MAVWSKNNLSCRTTWLALRILEQSKKTFSTSGTVRMDELLYWNAADTAAMRNVKAQTLAAQMDNIFTITAEARYEEDHDKIGAIAAMQEVLTTAAKTMADLAAVADENYLFFGEEE